ncbi:hypothetical protein SCHPADRAFT_881671 [Schizopora paradoxa]|uniref:HBS1-like protein N-terminal domain-containing protein n=1 Tax=Schizopora paradoxa TaxID=27342 RepID=A0A0H2R7Z1_9AGAM|nr:hypothetical protein SCHPADRAFT_881671 [Schizopora paradoxa]
MSRHRNIRNMNIEEELDVDTVSDTEDYEAMTADQQAMLEEAAERVREVIGEESVSGIPDSFMNDVIWNNYFDVDQSISYLLEERERRALAKERKGADFHDKDLPLPPEEMDDADDYIDDPYMQQGGYVSAQSTGYGNQSRRLSTITELTEDSKAGRQPLPIPLNQPPSSGTSGSYSGAVPLPNSSLGLYIPEIARQRTDSQQSGLTTSSYGQQIESNMIIDPNEIAPSPSLSAIRQLSIRTPSPSMESISSASTVRPVVPQVQYERPTITSRSSASGQSSSQTSRSPSRHGSAQSPMPLPVRASFHLESPPRSSSSSRSSSTVKSPAIHSPSSSARSSSIDERSAKGPSPIPPPSHSSSRLTSNRPGNSELRTESQHSSHRPSPLSQSQSILSISSGSTAPTKKSKLASLASSRASVARPVSNVHTLASFEAATAATNVTYPALRPTSTSLGSSSSVSVQNVDIRTESPERTPTSKLSKLSESRRSETPSRASTDSRPPLDRPSAPSPISPEKLENVNAQAQSPTPSTPSTTRPSKLALLAQAKVADMPPKTRRPKVMGPPFAQTKYLNPTSNTSSMTTAITTYIQTPDNMMSLARRELPPSFPPNGPAVPAPALTAGSKSSKLAIKARNSYAKSPTAEPPLSPSLGSQHDTEHTDDNDLIYRNRHMGSVASPSSFASILVDEDTEGIIQAQRERYKQRKVAMLPKHLLSPTRSTGSSPFAFDQPSPDDIVMQARRGTALASRESSQRSSGRTHSSDTRSRTSVPAVL